jgi:hypothetical protein
MDSNKYYLDLSNPLEYKITEVKGISLGPYQIERKPVEECDTFDTENKKHYFSLYSALREKRASYIIVCRLSEIISGIRKSIKLTRTLSLCLTGNRVYIVGDKSNDSDDFVKQISPHGFASYMDIRIVPFKKIFMIVNLIGGHSGIVRVLDDAILYLFSFFHSVVSFHDKYVKLSNGEKIYNDKFQRISLQQ